MSNLPQTSERERERVLAPEQSKERERESERGLSPHDLRFHSSAQEFWSLGERILEMPKTSVLQWLRSSGFGFGGLEFQGSRH